MKPDNPWIEATLDGFPRADPKNGQRRDLLVEAAAALPPDWREPGKSLPPVPESLKKSGRQSWKSTVSTSFVVIVCILLSWLLAFSPAAIKRFRDIVLTDSSYRPISKASFSYPINKLLPLENYESIHPAWLDEELSTRIPNERQALCIGVPGAANAKQRWTPLWESDPDDPALFAERVRSTRSGNKRVSSEYLDQAERIDPGNAYYDLIDLLALCDEAVEKSATGSPKKMRSVVKSPETYEAAWKKLGKILDSDQFESHITEMLRRRLEDWPPPEDYSDLYKDAHWLHSIHPGISPLSISTQHLAHLFSAEADRIAGSGNTDDMHALFTKWCDTLELLNRSEIRMNVWHLTALFTYQSHEAMQEACSTVGLAAEASYIEDSETLKADQMALLHSVGSRDSASSLNQWLYAGHGSDPSPGRLAEHRQYEGLYLRYASIITLLIIALFSALHLAAGSRLCGLPARLSLLLHPVDYVRIVLVAVVAPSLFVLLTLEIPALHPREKTFSEHHAAAILLKLAALLVGIVLLTFRQTSRCLSRRGWPLGFSPVASSQLLLLALLSLACAPVATTLMRMKGVSNEQLQWMWIGTFSLLGLILLLTIASASILLYSGHRRLHSATILRVASPIFTCAALLFCFLSSVDQFIEEKQVSQVSDEYIGNPELIDTLKGETTLMRQLQNLSSAYIKSAPHPP